MAMRNVQKQKDYSAGMLLWTLKDTHGDFIQLYWDFCWQIKDHPVETRKRYATVVARFIDYLYEVGVLGAGPVTHKFVNRALDYYLILLAKGENISLTGNGKSQASPESLAREAALKNVAQKLDIKPLATNSWSNTLPPLNKFLEVCEVKALEAQQMSALVAGISANVIDKALFDYRVLWDAIDGVKHISPEEVRHLKMSSMLGGVIRFRRKGLEKPKRLAHKTKGQQGYGCRFFIPIVKLSYEIFAH